MIADGYWAWIAFSAAYFLALVAVGLLCEWRRSSIGRARGSLPRGAGPNPAAARTAARDTDVQAIPCSSPAGVGGD